MKVDGLMASIVFGPVESRRYGKSLGLNVLPGSFKICSFDCAYCESGRTDRERSCSPESKLFPPARAIDAALREALRRHANEGRGLDAITLAGNGEPTLHPQFPAIINNMVDAREIFDPTLRLIALTNGTTLDRPEIRDALMRCDERVIKLDAVSNGLMKQINRPVCAKRVEDILEAIPLLESSTIQAMFVAGAHGDNSGDEHVDEWIERIAHLHPQRVQIYSLDRAPAEPDVQIVPHERLIEIGQRLMERTGVPATVY